MLNHEPSRLETLLEGTSLIVSAQASTNAAVDDPETLWKLAKCSLDEGVRVLRLQGVDNIRTIKAHAGSDVRVIGLIKQDYDQSEIYITPTRREVSSLLDLGCDVIALDASARSRPDGSTVAELVEMIHQAGALAMADCDSSETIDHAVASGCDLIGTTLAGYTPARAITLGPDFELVRYAVSTGLPVIAEGRYAERWEVEAALRIGAQAVVIGGAINDPVKQTRKFIVRNPNNKERVGAVDIGGTWIRFAVFESGQLVAVEREPLPSEREHRTQWIHSQITQHRVQRLGVGTGGTVDPVTGEVWEAKPIIPEHQGSVFHSEVFGIPTVSLNDGLATAWGHACHPDFAGKNVATLALGTGVGAGFVLRGEIVRGPRGEYPRLNDVMTDSGRTVEDLLGGAGLSPEPTLEQRQDAIEAFRTVVRLTREMIYPDVIVVAGSVGLSDWLRPVVAELGCVPTPYGAEAGIWGSYWLACR